jgi:hypothetical protein
MTLLPPNFSEAKRPVVDLRDMDKKEIIEYLLKIKGDLPQLVALYLKDVSPTQRDC